MCRFDMQYLSEIDKQQVEVIVQCLYDQIDGMQHEQERRNMQAVAVEAVTIIIDTFDRYELKSKPREV